MSTLLFRRKHATSFDARSAPVLSMVGREILLTWGNAENRVRTARTHDLSTFEDIDLPDLRTPVAPALVAGQASLVLSWVECDTNEVMVVQTRRAPAGRLLEERLRANDLRWGEPVRLGVRSSVAPSLAFGAGRFWLAVARKGDGRLLLISSADGQAWDAPAELAGSTDSQPALVTTGDAVLVSWIDAASRHLLLRRVAPDAVRRAESITQAPVTAHTVYERNGELFAAWSVAARGQIAVTARQEDGTWREPSAITERAIGGPAMASIHGKLALAWTRDDSPDLDGRGRINVAVADTGDGPANSRTFTGNVQGHPITMDPNHQTAYPYLATIVLPSDFQMPKGQTEASLMAWMTAAMGQVKAFWAEASYGHVNIDFDVHPHVMPLPSPMDTYVLRRRPKIIEGNGVAFPVAFAGGETLDIEASANFRATVTFPVGARSVDQIIDDINQSLQAVPYAGPAAGKPIAMRSTIGQVRIYTADVVDPGTVLRIAGGTAVNVLGFGPADLMTYEGHTKQEEHLDQMLTDALRSIVAGMPDPIAYLRQYFGVVVAVADNLGWYTLRAQAGGGDVEVVPGQDKYKCSVYWMTTVDAPDVFAHETGHNLGLPDLYEEGPRLVGAEPQLWDCMDANAFSHPTAWTKSFASSPKNPIARWMADEDVAVLVPPNQSLEAIVIPNESPFPIHNPYEQTHPGVPICHAIKIPLDANHAFFVENRQRGPYDDPHLGTVEFSTDLKGDGLIVTDAVNDPWATTVPRSSVVMVQPPDVHIPDVPDEALDEVWAQATTAGKQAVLAPYVMNGEIPQWLADKMVAADKREGLTDLLRWYSDDRVREFYPVTEVGRDVVLYEFPDGSGDIRVKILEVIGNARPQALKVRAAWGRQGDSFDLAIRRWENPPPYESPDIWIDSQENGWGTYLHHDAAREPTLPGNPILNGDRPWVGHENRVYARVWNHGTIAQNNVQVTFEAVIPPGQSTGYPFDTDYVNIPAGGYAIAQGTWKPLVAPPDEHGCISATIKYKPWDLVNHEVGEDNRDNNSAQENISDFYVEGGSPYAPTAIPFEFANPLPFAAEMRVGVHGLKRGWSVTASPYKFTLEPGERIEGEAILKAADDVPLEDPQEGNPAPVISLEVLVNAGCTWERVGGFSMIAHAVRKASIHAGVDPMAEAIAVVADAATVDGPVAGAAVAMRVIGPSSETLCLEVGTTDQTGHLGRVIPVPLARSGHDRLTLEVRLSPSSKTGPATEMVTFVW